MELKLTKKQMQFVKSKSDEILFGGAAGGGKSYAQVIDAFLFALEYQGSRQIIFRKTLKELERSILVLCRQIYPAELYRYISSEHRFVFYNGSVIELGYCNSEDDVYRYQSAEYDVLRFDELTHFSKSMYLYLMTRVRGTNGYPKQIKSTSNPGGVGHDWVKKRFIEKAQKGGVFEVDNRRYEFIPASVYDNCFLVNKDIGYIERLKQLSNEDKKKLLYGDWNVKDGQFFYEFCDKHIVPMFKDDAGLLRFCSMDYGLDMTSVLWWASDFKSSCYIYREFNMPNLTLAQAAKAVIENSFNEDILYVCASPDLWARRQERGVSGAEIMYECGLANLVKANNDRINGWNVTREFLRLRQDEYGNESAFIKIVENACPVLCDSMARLQFSKRNPNDADTQPHDATHATDALRYGAMSLPFYKREEKCDAWLDKETDEGFYFWD